MIVKLRCLSICKHMLENSQEVWEFLVFFLWLGY
jgi:hypothetical protein